MQDWQEHAFFQDQIKREKAARFITRPRKTTANLELERQATARLIKRLRALGLADIHPTTHSARFDLLVGNARVEVKAAQWYDTKRGAGRYQAGMHKSQADVVIFVAINGHDHDFVIPAAEIGRRKTLEVTSYDVNAYSGQWSPYLEAYDVLLSAVEAAPYRPRQLTLEVE